LPDGVEENYVYEYDGEFKFVKKHVIQSGHTHLGIQTATFAHDRWWFGCYGDPKILLVTDADFQMKGRYEFDCSLGIEGLPMAACCRRADDARRTRAARGACRPGRRTESRIGRMNENNQLLLRLGQAQIDAMFARQDLDTAAIDDSDFLPLLESVLTAYEQVEVDEAIVEELWQHAYAVYDRQCKEAVPESTAEANRELMQSYLLGKRRVKRRRR
jgi:hypothetical protein